MNDYNKYLQKELKTGNMSKTKIFKKWLVDTQGSKKGQTTYDFLRKVPAGQSPATYSENLLRNTKNDLSFRICCRRSRTN